MKTLDITKHAHRQIKKFTKAQAVAIYDALEVLKNWPECHGVKALTNRDDYRLRLVDPGHLGLGDIRAIFKVSGETIIITEVLKRNERTY